MAMVGWGRLEHGSDHVAAPRWRGEPTAGWADGVIRFLQCDRFWAGGCFDVKMATALGRAAVFPTDVRGGWFIVLRLHAFFQSAPAGDECSHVALGQRSGAPLGLE